jgi:hypothetical protein
MLTSTRVTDKGMAAIGGMTKLRELALNLYDSQYIGPAASTRISDAGIVHLKKLPELTYLNLHGANLTDKALTNLTGMKKMAYLNLDATKVSDGGLVHLKQMKELKTLRLLFTQVTDQGIEELRKE